MRSAPFAAVLVLGAMLVGLADPRLAHSRLRLPAAELSGRWTPRSHLRQSGALAGCCLVSILLLGVGRTVLLPATAAVALLMVSRVLRLSRARAVRRERQRDVITLCDGLSAELRAGLAVGTAVERSCADVVAFEPVIAVARLGGDVSAALRRCGERPGAEGLRAVAAAVDVVGRSGAGLAVVVERVASSLRSDDDARAEVRAALGPPRATAKMLALLPVFGVLLGTSMGSDPLTFLVRTAWGMGCLCGGGLLALSGVWWVESLATAAED